MTHVLRPAVGVRRDELPRQALSRSAQTASGQSRVLLAGGDVESRELRQAWSKWPIDVDQCADLAAALVLIGKSAPDLVVLGDAQGPLDAFEFLRALRQVDAETVVVLGLDEEHCDLETDALGAGASTVVRRPFSPTELLALLHPGPRGAARGGRQATPLDLGRLKVDSTSPRMWLDGVEVLLPHMEFRLLHHLAEQYGEIVPRAELETAAWGEGAAARSNSLSVHIARLRRRFQAGTGADWICSVRGFGYRLVDPAPTQKRGSMVRS